MSLSYQIPLKAASTVATPVDVLFYSLLALSTIVIFGVVAFMVYFMAKYRRGSPADRTPTPTRVKHMIEYTWILIPLGLFLGTFLWGAILYYRLEVPPPNAQEVFVVAKQWMWKFQHLEGEREIDILHVPRGVPIKLIMTSQDVIHSFYVPAFRIKQDVLPGRYFVTWFNATETGHYLIECAEYCGTHHADMHGRVVVMEPAEYARWLEITSVKAGLAGEGEKLFRHFGCSGCHGEHASANAPKMEGLYGRLVGLRGGRSVVADDNYLRRSIVRPSDDIVAGYDDVMPAYDGQIKEDQIEQIITYIRSLSGEAETQP